MAAARHRGLGGFERDVVEALLTQAQVAAGAEADGGLLLGGGGGGLRGGDGFGGRGLPGRRQRGGEAERRGKEGGGPHSARSLSTIAQTQESDQTFSAVSIMSITA